MINESQQTTHQEASSQLSMPHEEASWNKADIKHTSPESASALDSYKNTSTNAKVMIISDEAINADVMRDFLNGYGYKNIIVTAEISDAFDIIFQERPDAILYENSALTRPAFTVLKQIRNNLKTRLVPLLILTADTDNNTKIKALELGVVDVIVKPAAAHELALRLRNILSVKTYNDQIANYDALTKLPNQETFSSRVDLALKYSKRYKTTGAVLQIGLNRFKNINDAFGISVSDQLLKAVSERIKNAIRENDIISRVDEQDIETTLSRLDGNKFSLLLPIINKAEDAAMVSLRLHETIIAPYFIDEKELYLECKIGISIFPDDGHSKDTVINAASIALNQVKLESNVDYIFYSKELNALSKYRINMENNLRKALLENQFELFFQPKLSVKTKEVIGAEALLRWPHPESGYISPDEFIPLAEESGNMQALGRWVIHTVAQQINDWKKSGLNVPRIAINISSHQFQNNLLLSDIEDALKSAEIDASSLTIELTETAVKENIEQIVTTLNKLKTMGAKISIDDFGTGYSSLAQLTQLPLDEVKIDRSFTMDIGREKSTEAIILAIISMAHNLDFSVVAEGIETEDQLNFLLNNNCDEYQGYLFSPAITAEKFGMLIA